MQQIRVLVVDDSAFLRRNLPAILETDSEIKVVGTAADGHEALTMTRQLRPDVITLDVLMPVMDGLTTLKELMKEMPLPVVMVSSVTYEGARQTMEALSLGAVDYIAKPSGPISLDIAKIRRELVDKVKMAHASRGKLAVNANAAAEKFKKIVSDLSAGGRDCSPTVSTHENMGVRKKLIAIASSTGGPAALQVVLKNLPATLPVGVVIVQHIADGFSEALAERLNSISPLEIKVSADFECVRPGVGLLAPAGQHLIVRKAEGKIYAVLSREPSTTLHRPSADVLFSSVARTCGAASCGVILTGMGNDGSEGMKEMRDRGGLTIAQDEATSLIFGMPKAAIERGAIEIIAPLEKISSEIMSVMRCK